MGQEEDRAAAVEAFAAVVEQEDEKVELVEREVSELVRTAQSIEVRNAEEAAGATEFLARIAGERKRSESARTFLTKPLRDHVAAINARFKTTTAPLEEADQIVREKVIAYNREQERLRAEEQARLDRERQERERQAEEERRRQEAEARAAREAAAREAARAEAEAKAAERRRREELEREADERRREIAGMTDLALRATARAAASFGKPDDARMAQEELDARQRAREAQEAAAAARAREDEAREAEEAAKNAPLPDVPRAEVAPAGPIRSAAGSASSRKRWVATVVDPSRVPRKYLKVDEVAINKDVRAGVREIPGVDIEHKDELAVRAR